MAASVRAAPAAHEVHSRGAAVFTIVDRQELTKRDMISLTVEAPAAA